MNIKFYMQDMYNFNHGQYDIVSGTPDSVNGRFAKLGWAKEFKTYGTYITTAYLVDNRPKLRPTPEHPLKNSNYVIAKHNVEY